MCTFRLATIEDVRIFYNWANDPEVRSNAINIKEIAYPEHENWFQKKINEPGSSMLIFNSEAENIGQLRIDKTGEEGVITYSIDKTHRGKGYGTKMLEKGAAYFFSKHMGRLTGLVKENNIASIKAFIKAGFTEEAEKKLINGEVFVKFYKNG